MLRIVSEDGNGFGLSVLDSETGQDLTKVLSIAYDGKINLGQIVTAKFELAIVQVDAKVASADWLTKHPVTGGFEPLVAVEFRDGTRIEFPESGVPVVTTPKPSAQSGLDVGNSGITEHHGTDLPAGDEAATVQEHP